MSIHVGMLEALGVNMYTSVGQSLVEFIANGFDADAKKVEVEFPFEEIEKERKRIRDQAKEKSGFDHKQGVYDPLPPEVEIVISDDGHGMIVDEIETKFLVLSRNRRKEGAEGQKSESGNRTVMGRKGLGKLAGFGAAQEVEICTKRKGETYSTTVKMDFEEISSKEDVGKVVFEPEYKEGLDADEHGTTVKLRRLRCDSIKASESAVLNTLVRNFAHFGTDFDVFLGTQKVEAPEVDYEFVYVGDGPNSADGFGEIEINVEDEFTYPVRAWVGFRYHKEH
ncbi:MAG: ATP-binding protein, partial [Silicimonas sp.]|nr:ATP-binding protein [Silicimonas sp.]